MKLTGFSILLLIQLLLGLSSMNINAQVEGCTDPLAINFDVNAEINDGSCTYNPSTISPVSSTPLSTVLNESSGLILW